MSTTIALPAAALLLAAVFAPVAATAQRYGDDAPRYEQSYRGGYAQPGYGQRGYDARDGYANRGGYDRADYRDVRCSSGTGGTIIGAIAGGLLGRTIDTRGDRALGTVLGASAGALAGNAIGRSGNSPYCRR